MDAKAKVVQWQWRLVGDGDHQWVPASEQQVSRVGTDPDWEIRALITLTDHEAALAEVLAQVEMWKGNFLRMKEDRTSRETQLTTLFTGLEALAGGWESLEVLTDAMHRQQPYRQCADELRTLTNSAKADA